MDPPESAIEQKLDRIYKLVFNIRFNPQYTDEQFLVNDTVRLIRLMREFNSRKVDSVILEMIGRAFTPRNTEKVRFFLGQLEGGIQRWSHQDEVQSLAKKVVTPLLNYNLKRIDQAPSFER